MELNLNITGNNSIVENRILVLKNDRAGDLFSSIKLISSLINITPNVKIYLSELNNSFNFLFKKIIVKKINFNITFLEKIKIFIDIYKNDYDEVYILTPKTYYFYLPIFFRKIKFYAIVYDNKKRKRPNIFLRKFLFKYEIVSRNEINKLSYRDLQNNLFDKNIELDNYYSNLTIPKIGLNFKSLIPTEYIFFQFRSKFFEDLKWEFDEFKLLITSLKKKYKYVLFCSDIEINKKNAKYNNYFEKNYSIIDLNINLKTTNLNNENIFYLKNLSALDMFYIIKNAKLSLAKEGVVSHIAFFLSKKCHNLFNFKIKNINDYKHEKISYSEWCKGMGFSFSFLNSDINKAIRKINRHI